jgi:5'-deoxynucleotidase YfbR-like HD superfamily hydrolase
MNATTMQTFTGKLVDLAAFGPDDVRLADIAHALSIINRYNGHTKCPYSVAQHSVMVSRLVPEEHALWGLMHDASEAYLGDVARPLKAMLPGYVELEEHVQRTIARVFHLPWPIPPEVKVADNRALMAEKKELVYGDHDWGIEAKPVTEPIYPYCWQQAKKLFENRYLELSKW